MIKRILLFTFLLMICLATNASHWIGGNIEFECLGGNQYIIRYITYWDCSTSSANPHINIPLNLTSSCGTVNGTALPIGNEVQINNLCSVWTGCTDCNSSPPSTCPKLFNGISKVVYEDTVTLNPCSDWKASFGSCCRNECSGYTSNSVNCSSSWYIESTLDNLNAPCNSSPTFLLDVPPFICEGLLWDYTFSASDPDGDSLVYSLVVPNQTGSNTPLSLYPGYSASCFIPNDPGCPGGVLFDSTTGNIQVIPATNPPIDWISGYGSAPKASWWDGVDAQVYVAIKVEEYRNGQKIGEITRDFQLNTVENCDAIGDVFTNGIVNLNYGYQIDSSEIEVYLYDSVKFSIIMYDTSTILSFDMLSDYPNLFANASLNTNPFIIPNNGGSYVVADFFQYVVPVDTGMYTFIVKAQNQGCPVQLEQDFEFKITVHNQTNPSRNIGIKEEDTEQIFIYPNPFTHNLTFDIKTPNKQSGTLQIVSVTGQVVYSQTFTSNTPFTVYEDFTKGLYFAQIQIGEQLKVVKVLKL